jgi:hypothetical protein
MNKFFRGVKGKALGVGGLFAMAVASAHAEGELSTAVITELTAGKAEILLVGGAILTLVGVVALIRHIRSSAH